MRDEEGRAFLVGFEGGLPQPRESTSPLAGQPLLEMCVQVRPHEKRLRDECMFCERCTVPARPWCLSVTKTPKSRPHRSRISPPVLLPIRRSRCRRLLKTIDCNSQNTIAMYEALKASAPRSDSRPEPPPAIAADGATHSGHEHRQPASFKSAVCLRHPKACRRRGASIENLLDSVRHQPHHAARRHLPPPLDANPAEKSSTTHVSAEALKALSAGWCHEAEGCIASDWTPQHLPSRFAASLLHAGKSANARGATRAGISCFDLNSGGSAATFSTPLTSYTAPGKVPALCPDGSRPDPLRAAAHNSTSAGVTRQGFLSAAAAAAAASPFAAVAAAAAGKMRAGAGHVRSGRDAGRLSPVFEGEFGFELLHALPFLHWLGSCGMLAPTSACRGMAPFYFFSASHSERRCGTRPARSRWLAGSIPRGTLDGWSWAGRHSLQFYAYPSSRWMPPPLHAHYRHLPLPARPGAAQSGGGGGGGAQSGSQGGTMGGGTMGGGTPHSTATWRKRVWLQNKYYPEGHGSADNFWSLDEVSLILDRLLGSGFQVVYNHPELALLGTADVNDEGKKQASFQLGDSELIRRRFSPQLASGALLLLPQLAKGAWSSLSYNEVQLRVLAKSRCFLAPQGGASYLTFYQPGLHVVNDRTGKERCPSAQLASNGRAGTYWHYYTMLASAAGESIIYNVAGNRSRLNGALDVMVRSDVCSVDAAL